MQLETEVAVVGSGLGGATVARELANRRREVTLVEKGKWHRWQVGGYASVGSITRLVRSNQGGLMARGVTVGGSSMVFNGNAYEPPEWLSKELGIDISFEVNETRREIGIKPLPAEFYQRWTASQRLVKAAADLDIALLPQQKFIDADKCDPTCDDCMLGCRHGAKWTAREYVKQAQNQGAKLVQSSGVKRVIIEQGRARGVELSNGDEIRADLVVLCAGGIGTPKILQRSEIAAGENFFIDPMNVVMGVGDQPGTYKEMTFAFASEEFVESDGYLVGTVGSLTVFGAQLLGQHRLRAILRAPALKRVMGMFTKIGDAPTGRIHADGTIDKPYPEEDREKFRRGTEACKNILIKAGAHPDSICIAENIGGHPGGTAAIGTVVGTDLQALHTRGLYVCDASVLPRSPGRPPALTIIALARWLAKTL